MSTKVLVIAVAVALLFALPATAFQQYWTKQHCTPTDRDTMHMQIYLKWSNQALLDNYVHSGDASALPFDLESATEIADAQQMWRFVLRPSQASVEAVQARLIAADIAESQCTAQWDSFHCTNVKVSAVSKLFKVEMCSYKQETTRIVSAVPHLKGRLSTGAYWLANVKKASLKDQHIQYVGGVALFDPTHVPHRHEIPSPKKQEQQADDLGSSSSSGNNAVQAYYWPQNVTNGPVILMGLGLPEFASLSQLGLVQVALFCKDGNIANMETSSTLSGSCPANVPYPKSIQITIPELASSVALDFNDTNCMTFNYYEVNPYASQAVCTVSAHSVVQSMQTWGLYHINATVVFSDGSHSATTAMKNYWNAEYMSDMRVTNPKPLVPTDLRTMYGIDANKHLMNNKSAQGILEFSDTLQPGRGFQVSDLHLFLVQYGVVSEEEVEAYLAQWLVQIGTDEYESRGETSLDIEMMMSLAQTGKTYLWNIINGPGLQYVHWSQAFLAWGWNVTSGTGPSSSLPPSVWSISYGGPEWGTPNDSAEDADQLNNYFKLMTASGVTVVVSSGDSGAGFLGQYFPYYAAPLVSFPASSPYVLAVGATANHFDTKTNHVVQSVCSAADGNVITSGGGFSANYAMPSYQASAVASYIVNISKAGQAVPIGVRGLPDVAAIGAWVNIVMSAETIPVFGTSISAPVFSSLLSLANDQRRVSGNGTVKLANWMVYRAPAGVFVDVEVGSNCAGEQYQASSNFVTYPNGACYAAQKGWDPASGLGTPVFPTFSTYVQSWSANGIVLPGGDSGSGVSSAAVVGGVVGGAVGFIVLVLIVVRVTSKPQEGGASYERV